jgi:hypothetical protein
MSFRYGNRVRLNKDMAQKITPTQGTVAKRVADSPDTVWVQFDGVDPLAGPTLVPTAWLEAE